MASRPTFLLRTLSGAGIVVLIACGCVMLTRGDADRVAYAEDAGSPARTSPQETSPMNSSPRAAAALPAIDLAVPKKTETATFALG